MASVDSSSTNPNDPNNPNNVPGNVNQPGQNNQPATTSGAGGVTATGAGNITGQVAGTNNPSQPFQNISSYLAANAPQSKDLANQVAGTVTAPINEAQTGITNAADTFTKSVNAGFTPEDKDLTAAVSENPAYVVAQSPDNVTNFQKQLNDKYTGPTDFTQTPGFSDIEGKIANAQAQANNTQNESGIQTLLKSVEGPTTAGNNKLDSLLLSANPENYKTIQDAGTGAAALLPTLNQTTADQNALAVAGSTSAASSSAAAAKALQDALTRETGNLGNEQKSIEDIVNKYNASVGVVNPVTQNIAQAIQDFLSNNPQLSLSDATNALAPLMNLSNIEMPDQSTYAGKMDYDTIAALQKLGLSDTNGLPLDPSKANLAESFKLPTQLRDALGQAPGVTKALSDELSGLGGQIDSAVKPFADLQAQQGQVAQQLKDTQDQLAKLAASGVKTDDPQVTALKQQIADLNTKGAGLAGDIERLAPSLQWVNNAAPGYNDLIAAINAELGKLGDVGAPTLNYGPDAVSNPLASKVAGVPVEQQAGNAAAIGTGAGSVAAGAVPSLAAPGIADAITAGGSPAALDALGLSPLEAAGPASLAAYGTANIVQNSLKNPIQSGLMTLANTGLSLATLSLPPQIFQSIGKEIKDVMNKIGDFFGGLF